MTWLGEFIALVMFIVALRAGLGMFIYLVR